MKEADTDKLIINESTIAKATKCSKFFGCLNGNGHKCCEVKDCINNKVYFLNVKKKIICSYVVNFGNEQICTCPIRKELYNKLKI